MEPNPRQLIFTGKVVPNWGKFAKQLTLPGSSKLSTRREDWPEKLEPGSLNVKVDADGFPDDFDSLCDGEQIKKFDKGFFDPELVIPHDSIAGNTLPPTSG